MPLGQPKNVFKVTQVFLQCKGFNLARFIVDVVTYYTHIDQWLKRNVSSLCYLAYVLYHTSYNFKVDR